MEVTDRYAEGLIKAGLPGEPSGYYKLLEENRLSGEEIKELVFGRKRSGFDVWTGDEWVLDTSKSGVFHFRNSLINGQGDLLIDSENGMFCATADWLFEGLKDCCAVFRNPDGSPEEKNEYLSLHYYWIVPWSPAD